MVSNTNNINNISDFNKTNDEIADKNYYVQQTNTNATASNINNSGIKSTTTLNSGVNLLARE